MIIQKNLRSLRNRYQYIEEAYCSEDNSLNKLIEFLATE